MHCPQCGQHQVSDEMRFCSRCGFPLSVVTELLSQGGTLPEREAESSTPKLTSRQRGKRLSVLLLLTGTLLAGIAGLINESKTTNPLDDPGLAGTLLLFSPAIICIVAGFVRLLYALLLEGNAPGRASSPLSQGDTVESAHLDAARRYHALPASHSVPATDFGAKRVNTTEMVNIPSVTENTTKLLDEQS
jgi:hypothetical protein